jgi:hypothetical protein
MYVMRLLKEIVSFLFHALAVMFMVVLVELYGVAFGLIPATDNSMLSEFIRSIFNLFWI